MNKRLLLALYDRSGLGAYMPVDYKGNELEVAEHMEKFAELIVRECMAMCKTSVGNADYNTGRLHCLNNIKEHFGVEE